MQHYKSRKDDQLLQEAYSGMVEEKLGKVAASIGAAAALASGGCDGPNCKPEQKPKNTRTIQDPTIRRSVQEHELMLKLHKMLGKEFVMRHDVPTRNGRPLLTLDQVNTIRKQVGLYPIQNTEVSSEE